MVAMQIILDMSSLFSMFDEKLLTDNINKEPELSRNRKCSQTESRPQHELQSVCNFCASDVV